MAICGGTGGGDLQNAKVAFLMPDLASTRYELQDKPLFEARMKQLCPTCEVIYQNADSDAAKQQQQANSALAQGVKAIVIDPVDSAAAATIVKSAQSQQVPIIAYDRPIPATPADYYISFDNEKIGSMIAQSLVDHLKAEKAEGGILQVNGSPTDAAAQLIKKGIHSAVDPSGFKLLAEYDTPTGSRRRPRPGSAARSPSSRTRSSAWSRPTTAPAAARSPRSRPRAGRCRRSPATTPRSPPRSASSRATSTTRSPSPSRSSPRLRPTWPGNSCRARSPCGKTTLYDTPSELFVPTVVTKDNTKEVLFDSGIMKAADVCTGAYAKGCEELGIK